MNEHTLAKRTRRRHTEDLKRTVVAACRQPGASVAGVALAHGLNANMVRRWLREREGLGAGSPAGAPTPVCPSAPASAFLPISVAAPASGATSIRVEVEQGLKRVTVLWPVADAEHCATWLTGWLR
jgi:transposase